MGGNAALCTALKAECQAFEEFCDILRTEQKTLTAGETDKLMELAQHKSDKIVLLSHLAEKRNRFLGAQPLSPDQSGMEHWLERHAAEREGEIGTAWRRLLDLARSAQRLNQENGAMIEAKMRHNQQALAVLQSAAAQASLYGPDGMTHPPGKGRPLGKV
jgi:flagella synthesis protein FlgN